MNLHESYINQKKNQIQHGKYQQLHNIFIEFYIDLEQILLQKESSNSPING